jgi:hypothetical protein
MKEHLMANKNFNLTQADLLEIFTYNDGNLVWKNHRTKSLIGKNVGYIQTNGYTRINLSNGIYYLHRLIFLYHVGRWPLDQIDHIDGNPRNNRIENLREATNSQNNHNKKSPKSNTSGYKGVSYCKAAKKWEAYITINKKRKYLGLFECPKEAAKHVSQQRSNHLVEFALD